jgi:hypothetical protein
MFTMGVRREMALNMRRSAPFATAWAPGAGSLGGASIRHECLRKIVSNIHVRFHRRRGPGLIHRNYRRQNNLSRSVGAMGTSERSLHFKQASPALMPEPTLAHLSTTDRSMRSDRVIELPISHYRSAARSAIVIATRPCPRTGLLILTAALVAALSATPADAQTNSGASATATAAVESVPFPNRLNQNLPAWLRVRAEFRERMETVESAGFTSGRDDVYWLSRLRFNVAVTPARWLGLHAQIQDARVARKDVGAAGTPFSAPVDVRLAHVDLGTPTSRVTARVGRQELAFGEQRLVGHVSWLNAARTFDAARLTLRAPRVQVDVFAGSVVRIETDGWDRSGHGGSFHGVHATSTSLVPRSTIEPYFFWRSDRGQRTEAGATARLRLGTTGVRLAGSLPAGFDYGLETAVQRGSIGGDSTRAWAQHLRLRTPALGRGVRLVSEYNFASGDAAPADGRRGTFDPLYPTPHDKYGLADQVGWRNIHHLRAAVELASIPRWPITAAYHSWWLASATDGLYLASGAQLARLPGGAADRHVGHEFDVQVSRALTPQLQIAGGYAHIRPGAFLRAATPGRSFHSTFLMLTYVFLSER